MLKLPVASAASFHPCTRWRRLGGSGWFRSPSLSASSATTSSHRRSRLNAAR